ncbi:MAG: PTS transporter subunit EIIA [Nitrospirales bacterium]|nr:PTS transporter subunit EIIA [Nitrospirales bacterium]
MNLSVKDVATLLNLSEKTIYRMIQNETIPCFRVGGQWRFDRREIQLWMEDTRQFSVNTAVNEPSQEDEELIAVAEFLRRGGIHNISPGQTKESAIRLCIERITSRLTHLDPKRLFSSIMEREALCPTAVGHGIALPHPRRLSKLTDLSSISLCRLSEPIPFDALDNEAVDTLFFIFPKSERRFLRIEAKLLRLMRDNEVLAAIKEESEGNLFGLLMRKEMEIFGGSECQA